MSDQTPKPDPWLAFSLEFNSILNIAMGAGLCLERGACVHYAPRMFRDQLQQRVIELAMEASSAASATLTARCEALEAERDKLRDILKQENKAVCEAVQDAARWDVRYKKTALERDELKARVEQWRNWSAFVYLGNEALNYADEVIQQRLANLHDEQLNKAESRCEALTAERDAKAESAARWSADYAALVQSIRITAGTLQCETGPTTLDADLAMLKEARTRCQHLEQVLQNMANDAEGIRDTINLVLKEGK